MPIESPRTDSLVLYKGRPARVAGAGDKLEIVLPEGGAKRVRAKDVALLHPGPVRDLTGLNGIGGEIEAAWEVLAGETCTLADLAELAYGEYSPASAWSAWQTVADGVLFEGTPEAVRARTGEEVEAERTRREAKEREQAEREAFFARVRAGQVSPEDARRLGEVERLAYGRQGSSSPILRELELPETPESAHRFLLRVGHWDETVNPHPVRVDAPLEPPELEVPDLPDEPRRDLTHLDAFAIDEADNEDPDDALSLEGDVLWVHVADAAALAAPDTALDHEARARGATLYLPERITPMLPFPLVNRLGLGLEEVSPAMSFGLRVDEEGNITDTEIVASWVRVTRVSYSDVESRLDEAPFAQMHAITRRFRARREPNAVMLQLPEVRVRVVDGEVRIESTPALTARELVTESMLMVGEAAAAYAQRHDIPIPYATQPAPETPVEPDGMASMFACVKQLRPTRMKTAPEPHAGLGLSAYAQATSPLRRYLDLVVQQQLRRHLRGETVMDDDAVLARVGAAEAVRGALRKAERLSNQHWKLVYLQRHGRWHGTGIVIERQSGRGRLMLPDLGMILPATMRGEPPLDAELDVEITGVDLPALDAHVQVK